MKRFLAVVLILLAAAGLFFFLKGDQTEGKLNKNSDFESAVSGLLTLQSQYMEENDIDIRVSGRSLTGFDYDIKLDDSLLIYADDGFMKDIMGCSVVEYSDGRVAVDRGEASLEYKSSEVERTDDKLYIPIEDAEGLGYDVNICFADSSIDFVNIDNDEYLPSHYDLRDRDRVTPVRDQGQWGTCWAFASLGALETVLLPKEQCIYSVDHMSLNNGFSLELSEGGEHSMSIAYLAAWNGPVYEKDDVYDDGKTDSSLKAVKHLEEAIVMDERDDTKIKNAIYKYGGVETSIYLEMAYGNDDSEYYNSDTASYYYSGDQKSNHDLVVIGWDDNYPKENFSIKPGRDGAYICKNSWGTGFGDEGFFYISYDDVNICTQSIVYTRLGEADNYDNIYQTDQLGWVGQMGFSEDSAYFANVYTAERDENLSAISFYATGPDTKFRVYVVPKYEDIGSLNANRVEVGNGETRYAGYYTVDLNHQVTLEKGQRFAVMVSVVTPGSERPIAIECEAGERTGKLDLSDGEGYMSLYGQMWHRAEESDANICLKAFTVY